ncbi:flavin reductase [Clostridiales bacterium PH28_bin88]|nr:flavin reductase [Clostridiales bacterium PH28_bin88]
MSNKIKKAPYTALYPVPAVLVTCADENLKPNVITIAWTGTVNSVPPMVYVSVRPDRFSYKLIKETGEFVINVPSAGIVKEVDFCGMNSGRDVDKFAATGLTPLPAAVVKAPLIKECPVNIECQVKQVIELGSHHMFIGEIVSVHIDQDSLNQKGQVDMDLAKAVSYCAGEYRGVDLIIGTHGYSRRSR